MANVVDGRCESCRAPEETRKCTECGDSFQAATCWVSTQCDPCKTVPGANWDIWDTTSDPPPDQAHLDYWAGKTQSIYPEDDPTEKGHKTIHQSHVWKTRSPAYQVAPKCRGCRIVRGNDPVTWRPCVTPFCLLNLPIGHEDRKNHSIARCGVCEIKRRTHTSNSDVRIPH